MIKTGKNSSGYLIVLFAAAVLYIATCAPSTVWQDSGMIQYRIIHKDIEGGLGLALSHPLYYIISIATSLVPIGQIAYRINITNAVISAFAVANMFMLVKLISRKNVPAIIAALSLGLSHTFWRHAAIPETYNLTAALLLLELIMVVKFTEDKKTRYLYFLFFINGISIANHMLGSIGFIGYCSVVILMLFKKHIKARTILIMAALWIIGAIPYEYLIIKNICQTGDIPAVISSALFGNNWQKAVLNTAISPQIVKENIMWIGLNFPTPIILFAVVGIIHHRKIHKEKWLVGFLFALTGIFFAFAFRYTIVDRYAFFIPFYCMVSIFIGIGVWKFKEETPAIASAAIILLCFLNIAVYTACPAIAENAGIKSGRGRTVPYRNDYTYFLQPWKMGCRGPEKFAKEALEITDENAIIYADGTTVYPLLYAQQIKNIRPDVKIVSGHGSVNNLEQYNEGVIDEIFLNHSIYVVSPIRGYCPEFLIDRYDFTQNGVLWKAADQDSFDKPSL